MGATAESRLAKRRINELEEKLKKMQRELQQLKAQNRKIGRLRKEAKAARNREEHLRDLYEEEEALAFDKNDITIEAPKHANTKERCRNESCLSDDLKLIPAGNRFVAVCNQCQSRFSFLKNET